MSKAFKALFAIVLFGLAAVLTLQIFDMNGPAVIDEASVGTSYTRFTDLSFSNSLAVGSYGNETEIIDSDGNLDIAGDFTMTGDALITSVLKGLDIDVTSAGADTNYFGIDNDVTQGAVAGGAYLSRGNLIGAANSIAAIGNIDATYATYSLSNMVMAADTEANQLYGGIFMSHVSGAKTLTLHDGLVGAQFAIEVDSGVTDVTGGIVAAAFMYPNVQKAITSLVYGAYVKCTNYTDYGVSVIVESNNISAGLQVLTKDSAVLPIGLEFTSTSGSITNDIALSGGQFVSGGTDGVPSAAGASAVEYAAGVFKTVITVDATGANIITLDNKDDGAGVLLYTFPVGHIQILGVTADLEATSSAGIFQSNFPMAIGSAAAADGEATLTALEDNFSASQAISYDGAQALDCPPEAIALNLDGTSSAITVYLNAAVANANINAESTVGVTGTVTIHWMNLGDY